MNPEIPMPALPTTIVAERRPPAPNGHDTTNNRRNWTTNRAETAPHRHDRPRPQTRSYIIAEHRCKNEHEKSPSFRAKFINAFLRTCN
jgi:Ni/Co efflux regulator RcnB